MDGIAGNTEKYKDLETLLSANKENMVKDINFIADCVQKLGPAIDQASTILKAHMSKKAGQQQFSGKLFIALPYLEASVSLEALSLKTEMLPFKVSLSPLPQTALPF